MTRWIILRTASSQTLQLARSLGQAGFNVWTPARTIRRVLRPGKRTEQHVEVDIPILPSFVFAHEDDLLALADAAAWRISPHPDFSIFHHAGKIPLVADRDVVGLKEEEARAAATMRAIRDAETHAEAERIRIAAIKSEAARRRATWALDKARIAALRAQRSDLEAGTEVLVEDMPALAGVRGVVEANEGVVSRVRIGTQTWKIEAWRLAPVVEADRASRAFRGERSDTSNFRSPL